MILKFLFTSARYALSSLILVSSIIVNAAINFSFSMFTSDSFPNALTRFSEESALDVSGVW